MLLMLSPLFVFSLEGWKRQPLQIDTQISCRSGCEGPSEPHFWHDFRDPVAYSHGPVRGAMGPEVEEHVQESALGEENRWNQSYSIEQFFAHVYMSSCQDRFFFVADIGGAQYSNYVYYIYIFI